MIFNRRKFLTSVISGMGLLTLSKKTFADDPRYFDKDLIIHSETVNKNKNNIYDFYSKEGLGGKNDNSYFLEPIPGLKLNIFLPPNQKHGNLIVFSHAELLNPLSYKNILEHWASHGFIVVAPNHMDNENSNDMELGKDDNPIEHLKSILLNENNWNRRIKECHQVLDVLNMIESASGFKINAERPIIAGHSFGAWTAQMIIGMQAQNPSGNIVYNPDNRYYAALAMSPIGLNYMGLSETSWDKINRPCMYMSGKGDTDAFAENGDNKISGYFLTKTSNQHLVWFDKIWSSFFVGNNIFDDSLASYYFHDILSLSTSFFVSYSNYDKDVFVKLTNHYFENAAGNRLSTDFK